MTKTKTVKPSATKVEDAQKVLNKLHAKHQAIATTRAEEERELEAISFAAHTGDTKAAAALDDIKARAVMRDLELKSISSARIRPRTSGSCRARDLMG